MEKDARKLPNAMKPKIPAMKPIKTPRQIFKARIYFDSAFYFLGTLLMVR